MVISTAARIVALSVPLCACVGPGAGVPPAAVPTNGPAACTATAAWQPQEQRIAHEWVYETLRMGEYLACDVAKRQLAQRSASVCQTALGSRTDIRDLVARTQFHGSGYVCDCREVGMFTACTVEGDALCSYEEAVPGSYSCD
ncbi:MAG: hypothetical protein R3F55_21980 [Alphaproteobacteria bacterium]